MPTITYTLDDGFGTPDAEIDLWWQPVSPHGESGALVVSGPPKTITSKVGTPTTITNIAATQWRITGLGAYLNESVTIDIPEAGGDVTDRIKAAISIPPGTPVSTLVQAAKTATEIALDELDVPSKEVLDATYVRTVNGTPVGPDGNVSVVTTGGLNRTVIIGPSLEEQIGAGIDALDPTFANAANSALRARGWFHWCNGALGGALNLVKNSGVGGERWDQMLARFDTDVTAYTPAVVIIGSATNSVTAGHTVANMISQLDQMIAKARAIGAIVIVLTNGPRSTFDSTAKRVAAMEVNRYIEGLAGRMRGVIGVDTWRPVADLATGSPKAGTTIDGTHWSISGAAQIGFSIASQIRHLIPPVTPPSSWTLDPRRVVDNPGMLTNGDGWADNSGGISVAYAAEAGRVGNTATITVTGNSSLTSVRGIKRESVSTDGYWQAGDIVQLSARVSWSGLTALAGNTAAAPVVRVEQLNSGGGVIKSANALASFTSEWPTWPTDHGTALPTPAAGDMVLTTWRTAIDASCATLRIIVGFLGAASVTMKVSDVAPLKDAASTEAHPSGAPAAPYVRPAPGVSGYVHRWLAQELVGTDGTAVSAWGDSENGIALSQGTSGLQPTLQTVNGRRVVRFDGVDDFLGSAAALSAWSSALVVFRFTDDAPTAASYGVWNGGSGGDIGMTRNDAGAQLRPGVFFAGAASATLTTGSEIANGSWKAFLIRNTDLDRKALLQPNNIAATNTAADATTTATTFQLGRRNTAYAKVEIAEVILYPATLSDADMATLWSYVQTQHAALFA
ncbi:esterase/lipase [Gordonia phage DobbysSock]|uniref:Minor tail protein n=1 Tax=Gordonia phage DobbysSock TaxID=2652880 RepID=A0A5P8DAW6_9CAUD|nr:esterase/lipase [Gordonia phage DobbysSock]QFP96148.1 hypothetical protein DOBBYSSOCK_SEA_27 [Gordonia phage DobbysSock]